MFFTISLFNYNWWHVKNKCDRKGRSHNSCPASHFLNVAIQLLSINDRFWDIMCPSMYFRIPTNKAPIQSTSWFINHCKILHTQIFSNQNYIDLKRTSYFHFLDIPATFGIPYWSTRQWQSGSTPIYCSHSISWPWSSAGRWPWIRLDAAWCDTRWHPPRPNRRVTSVG